MLNEKEEGEVVESSQEIDDALDRKLNAESEKLNPFNQPSTKKNDENRMLQNFFDQMNLDEKKFLNDY